MPIWVDNSGIARARNVIVKTAEDAGARLLLTIDSDTFALPQHGGLSSMWDVMREHDAAVVAAAVVTRNSSNRRLNCEPVIPGTSYEGECGSAYMLIDLWRLRDLPRPWFKHQDSKDGLKVECGEDIYFARHCKAYGHKYVVNFELPMGHIDNVVLPTFE